MKQEIEYNIGLKTFFWAIVFLLGGLLAWQLFSVIIIIITSLMLAATLYPLVKWLNRWFSTTISAALILIILILPLVFVIISLVPLFIAQSIALTMLVIEAINHYALISGFVAKLDLMQYTAQGGQYLLEYTGQLTTFMTEMTITLFMAFYIIIDAERLHELFIMVVPRSAKKNTEKLLVKIAEICGQYIRGNIIISVICTLTMYIGLLALGVPNAVPLAIFAGLMDLLPNIGATIGTVPAVIIAFTISPWVGVGTLILYVAYQIVENNILSPTIYNKTLHLIPFLNFTAVIIGTLLLGVVGAFLALPIAASLQAVVSFFHSEAKSARVRARA